MRTNRTDVGSAFQTDLEQAAREYANRELAAGPPTYETDPATSIHWQETRGDFTAGAQWGYERGRADVVGEIVALIADKGNGWGNEFGKLIIERFGEGAKILAPATE